MFEFLITNPPTRESSETNRALISPEDRISRDKIDHVSVHSNSRVYVFTLMPQNGVEAGKMAFNNSARLWAGLVLNQTVKVEPYNFDLNRQCLSTIKFSARYKTQLGSRNTQPIDTEVMSRQFSMSFPNQAFTVGQLFGFFYRFPNGTKVLLELEVKELEAIQVGGKDLTTSEVEVGLSTANTISTFKAEEGCDIQLVGGKADYAQAPRILDPNWNFESMGIGGLSSEFSNIFRRAFNFRLLPPKYVKEMDVDHVRGMLLFGPPGTGKTLLARQIGKMLNSREPKVVNGPEILDKYVGESERNIRLLFAEAEEEQAKMGDSSGLHIIIFDEIDAICKARSAQTSSAGGGDTVVNQLLTKIDGVNALQNVLVIGMTNRRDLIDEALLRPGRLEVQVEIGLPNESGRLEIFKIHTKKMKDSGFMSDDVDVEELASITKNFTGAEIKGLVRAAQSYAVNRLVQADGQVQVDIELLKTIKVTREDFMAAIDKDIKPALGASEDRLKKFGGTIIIWDNAVQKIIQECDLIMESARHLPDTLEGRQLSLLVLGEGGSGQTAIAANCALKSKFPFIRMLEPRDLVGLTEIAKVQYINKLFTDAYRSEQSCIVIDSLEDIIEYTSLGPRFSTPLLKAFIACTRDVPPKGRSCLIICTCGDKQLVEDLRLYPRFTKTLNVPSLTKAEQVERVLDQLADEGDMTFTDSQRAKIVESLRGTRFNIRIKQLMELATFLAPQDKPEDRERQFLTRLREGGYIDHLESARLMGV